MDNGKFTRLGREVDQVDVKRMVRYIYVIAVKTPWYVHKKPIKTQNSIGSIMTLDLDFFISKRVQTAKENMPIKKIKIV